MESSRSEKRHKTLLNEFVFYVFFKVSSWQSMRDIHATSLDELTEPLLYSRYAELLLSRPRPQCLRASQGYCMVQAISPPQEPQLC